VFVEVILGIGQVFMRNGSEHKASFYQFPNQLCAITGTIVKKIFHSPFGRFIRNQTGNRVIHDTKCVPGFSHATVRNEFGFIHAAFYRLL